MSSPKETNNTTTALFEACLDGDLENMKKLYTEGERMSDDEKEYVLLTVFEEGNHGPIWDELLHANRELTSEQIDERRELLTTLVEYGAKIDSKDAEGNGIVILIFDSFEADQAKDVLDVILSLADSKDIERLELVENYNKDGQNALIKMCLQLLDLDRDTDAAEYTEVIEKITALISFGADIENIRDFKVGRRTLWDKLSDLGYEEIVELFPDMNNRELENGNDDNEDDEEDDDEPVAKNKPTPKPTPKAKPAPKARSSPKAKPSAKAAAKTTQGETGAENADNGAGAGGAGAAVGSGASPEVVIATYMKANGIAMGAKGGITGEILTNIAKKEGITGLSSKKTVDEKKAFIAEHLNKAAK